MKKVTALYLVSLMSACGTNHGDFRTNDDSDRTFELSLTEANSAMLYRNYLKDVLSEERLAATFKKPVGDIIAKNDYTALLEKMGIFPFDAAQNSYFGTTFLGDSTRSRNLANEFLDAKWSDYYFSYTDFRPQNRTELNNFFTKQGGFTTRQFNAWLRVVWGDGRCASNPAGSNLCPAYVGDLQDGITMTLNPVFNIRTMARIDDQYANTLTNHRESIAYRLVYDALAKEFGGYNQNPLSSIVLDVSNENTDDCKLLTSMLANGKALKNYAESKTALPEVMGSVTQNLMDGKAEVATDPGSGKLRKFFYGLFPFMTGNNCSRINPGECYEGDPQAVKRITELIPDFTRPISESSGSYYTFTCKEIATLVNVTGSSPTGNRYDAILNESAYPFDDEYPQVTAEDLMAFILAIGNAHVNTPSATFIDNIPQSDADALVEAGIQNAELEWHIRMVPHIFDLFLDR